MSKLIICKLILILSIFSSIAQTPFDCRGKMFRVVERGRASLLQEVHINEQQQATFEDLKSFEGKKINGIAYNQFDDLIYGVLLEKPYKLCRIDASYKLEVLANLPLPTDFSFVSGDISPDGEHLVLLGFSMSKNYNLLATIQLTSPTFNTTVVTTKTLDQAEVYCADIAFHPVTNILYGFDHAANKLITIDLNSKKIDTKTYPNISTVQGNMPTLFFNAQGRLYGIGSSTDSSKDRNLYEFDLESGQATYLQALSYDSFQDGCSCPVLVELLSTVSQRHAFACTSVSFEFTLLNKTGTQLTNLQIENSFPSELKITAIGDLPFVGKLEYDNHHFNISEIVLPPGRFVFQVQLEIEELSEEITLYNQARLSGTVLQGLFGEETIYSDDPLTVAFDDPTEYTLFPELKIEFPTAELVFCPGDTVAMQPMVSESLHFTWSNGEHTPSIQVSEPGWYEVTVTTGCQSESSGFEAHWDLLEIELGKDQEVEIGERHPIRPSIYSDTEIVDYTWKSVRHSWMKCDDCSENQVRLKESDLFELEVTNQNGCTAKDYVQLTVTDFAVYQPNAFSPNGDGYNDVFFLQSRTPYTIEQFQIFDRWGVIIWEKTNVMTNDASEGWNGLGRSTAAPSGLYLWRAVVIDKSEERQYLQGEVNVLLERIPD